MVMYCDNQATMHIANNLVFHERTKYIEMDCQFIWYGDIILNIALFVTSSCQLGDIPTKPLSRKWFSLLCNKLDMTGMCARIGGEVL